MRIYYNVGTGAVEFTLSTDLTGLLNKQTLPFIETDLEITDLSAWVVINQELVAVTDVSPELLIAADDRVNLIIGRARSLFITDAPGQQMTYLAKQTEFKELLVMVEEPADPSIFPFLFAEIGITGTSITEVAQIVLNLAHQWGLIGSSLEKIRMGTNAQIALAQTRTELLAIDAAFKDNLGVLLSTVGKTLQEVYQDDL